MFTPASLSKKKQKFVTLGRFSVLFGYSVILAGLLVVLGTIGVLKNGFSSQRATICDTTECTEQVNTTTETATNTFLPDEPSSTENTVSSTSLHTSDDPIFVDTKAVTEIRTPKVEFHNLSETPVLDKDMNVLLRIENAHSPRLELVSPTLNYRRTIDPMQATADRAYYLLPTMSAPAGEYFLHVSVLSKDTNLKSIFTSRRFFVKHQTATDTNVTTNNPVVTTETSSNNEPEIEVKLTEPVVEVAGAISYNVDFQVEKFNPNKKIFKVLAKTKNTFERVELYLRNSSSVQRTFLGMSTKVPEGYVYWFDTSSIPTGTYHIILQGRVASKIVHIETSDKLEIVAPALSVPVITKEIEQITTELKESTTETSKIDYLSLRSEATTIPKIIAPAPVRRALPPPPISASIPQPTSTTTISQTIEDEDPAEIARVRELMLIRTDTLNNLLQKRASAEQTDDETVTRLADEELEAEVKALSRDAGGDEEDRAQIERLVTVEIDRIKQKIETTENIIKARTNNKSARDSDLDGISDYDEVTIYQTNPKEVDSDTDGVIDGIEIMRGFDPTNAVAEAVIDYSSPKEFGYVNDDVLKIEYVAPIVDHGEEGSQAIVKSEIRGYGLPNSFVTLYIFSSPTVVTVKTNTDGSFAYIFEKELDDGAHEVYVALTDNTGDIVVKSNAFSFVKTAQAFTYEDSQQSNNAAPAPLLPTDVSKTFIISVAMSVVALGFVLVLLGHMLRTRRQEEEIIIE